VAGGFVTYSILNQYAFTAKVLFNQKGAKWTVSQINGEVKERLNYVEIPVLARVFFNREGTVRPNVFFGPSFGFLTEAKLKLGEDDYKNVQDVDTDLFGVVDSYKDVYNAVAFRVSLGLGLSIKVGDRMYFVVDTRYTYGLSEVYKNADASSNDQNATVTAGLSFGIGNDLRDSKK